MNKRLVLLTIVALAFHPFALRVGAQPYSIREVGFVDVEVRPFRLVFLARDLAAPGVKKQKASVEKEIARSNITLVAQQADAKTVTPDKTPVGDLAMPRLWLIGPDDRVIPFSPTTPTLDLVQSPLRQQIWSEVSNALCAVVLLESPDQAVNEIARAKAQRVIEDVNRVRKYLHNLPERDVVLLTLPVADRPRERWTLWGLGEDVAASEKPKIAVVFGRMRRAGALFEGIDWRNDELFGRIASLGQVCEDELDRKEFFGPALPFQWSKNWITETGLPFDPQSDEIIKEMSKILTTPELPAGERTPRRRTFESFDIGEPVVPVMEVPREEPRSVFAGFGVGVTLFVAGLIGWIGLGAFVLFLEREGRGRASADHSQANDPAAGRVP